jgi:hypothetical protein
MLLQNLLLIQPQTFQLPAPDCTRGTKHSVENSSLGSVVSRLKIEFNFQPIFNFQIKLLVYNFQFSIYNLQFSVFNLQFPFEPFNFQFSIFNLQVHFKPFNFQLSTFQFNDLN